MNLPAATPADMPQTRKEIPSSARTRASLEGLITALAEAIAADTDGLDMEAVIHLTRLVRSAAELTQAQADLASAINVRYAQRQTA
ncbi:hypothetical protein ACF07B_03285 [Streptomyces sp. NPDC015532]|uniref:hypothetical protein n=1 Tax=Streptomyces sp. NPDC015532 TaxID=3364960 RepID=UPI0036F6F29B